MGLALLFLALTVLTVAYQSVKAVLSDPAEILRIE